jgi:hypothetical protein
MASQLMTLPTTGPEHGFAGWHDVPIVGTYPTYLRWSEVEKLIKKPINKPKPAEMKRPPEHEYITDWKPEDFIRLDLKIPPDQSGANPLL